MLWCLGVENSEVALYNDAVQELKHIELQELFKHMFSGVEGGATAIKYLSKYCSESVRQKHYEAKELTDDIETIQELLVKSRIKVENIEGFARSLCTGEDYYYIYAMELNSFMDVVDKSGELSVVSRMDTGKGVVNGITYTMVYPDNINFGVWKQSPTFEYVCRVGETFLQAKKELLDFDLSGVADYVTTSKLLHYTEEYGRMDSSKDYKGLATYRLNKDTNSSGILVIDELVIPEGVTVLDSKSFELHSGRVLIHKLILPSTLRFILPNTFNTRVRMGEIDMSKTGITKLHHIFHSEHQYLSSLFADKSATYTKLPNLYKLNLPKRLQELELVNYSSFVNLTANVSCAKFYFPLELPDTVTKVRGCLASHIIASEKSNLNYMGPGSVQVFGSEPVIFLGGKKVRRYAHTAMVTDRYFYQFYNIYIPYVLFSEQPKNFRDKIADLGAVRLVVSQSVGAERIEKLGEYFNHIKSDTDADIAQMYHQLVNTLEENYATKLEKYEKIIVEDFK